MSDLTDTARVIEVIETTLTRRGKGVEGDPIRIITQYWSQDGKLLAEKDPWRDQTITERVLPNSISTLQEKIE